jgi:2-amino-4-hydroxy-6-hydroxymethyldihydropteridine diphosphokinase
MIAGIGLGSNLGDRLAHLRHARDRLRQLDVTGAFRQSAVYETAPVDCPAGSGAYLNAAIEIDTDWPARSLVETLWQIEAECGRRRTGIRNEPRALDLDLLYFGDLELDEPDLAIPHPRMSERRFVLGPLSEICPDREIPGVGKTVRALLAALPGRQDEIRIYRADW